ncbi:hypothetical protein G6011_10826 [Alternaria panax]|uniref:Uncharacterized protein n=1 Tax=Alternaria panax TaxID=48097 RepID=A0AAD4ICN2_9PLEO|nr:hypothetical protein G6011_10826 [Alternaria panax]
MQIMYDLEKKEHRVDEELDIIFEALRLKVLPRLLCSLENGVCLLELCLLYSDLWPGNCMMEKGTREIVDIVLYAFWDYNKCDLGSWRAFCYNTDEDFFTCYKNAMEPLEPKEDGDDRNRLYAILICLYLDILYPLTTGNSPDDLLVSALYREEAEFYDR